MPLFELKGMNGASVFLPAVSISRFKPIKKGKPGDGTKVDYAGKSLFTPESGSELAGRLKKLAPLAKFTLRADMPVWVNAAQATDVREATELNGPGTEMRVGGLYQHVVEELDVVVQRLNAALEGGANA